MVVKKEWLFIGMQVGLILFVMPLVVYRGMFYFRPQPNPEVYQVSSSLLEQIDFLRSQLEELEIEVETFRATNEPKLKEQQLQREQEMKKIEESLRDLQAIYEDEKQMVQNQLINAWERHRRSYYDFALFVGTMWILTSAFIQMAYLRMSINVFGLASVLIGLIGTLVYIQETPRLSMWLLMLFFSILAIAFIITGYQIATRLKKYKKELEKGEDE